MGGFRVYAYMYIYIYRVVNTPYIILCHGYMGRVPIAFAGVGAAENKGIAFGGFSHNIVTLSLGLMGHRFGGGVLSLLGLFAWFLYLTAFLICEYWQLLICGVWTSAKWELTEPQPVPFQESPKKPEWSRIQQLSAVLNVRYLQFIGMRQALANTSIFRRYWTCL